VSFAGMTNDFGDRLASWSMESQAKPGGSREQQARFSFVFFKLEMNPA
jgi:hypothetical protein